MAVSSDDRLAFYGLLVAASGAALHYFPLGVTALGVIMVGAAMLRSYVRGRNG